MNRHDLNLAFYRQLIALTYASMVSIRPDEIFDPKDEGGSNSIRRGFVLLNDPETIAFGNGVYSRIAGIYQIDIWVPRELQNAFKTTSTYSDAHVLQFWPANGRGLTLTENSTSAHIVKRPSQKHLGREGSYLRDVVEVDFYVEDFPS